MKRIVSCLPLALAALVGCGNAPETVQGGEPLVVDPCTSGGPNAGHRWQDLYACYFGPSGQASCGSRTGCHGAADQPGAMGSGGYVCPAQHVCWQSMTSTFSLTMAAADPTGTFLYASLRKPNSMNPALLMPKDSSFVFQAEDLARIAAWIQEGAPED